MINYTRTDRVSGFSTTTFTGRTISRNNGQQLPDSIHSTRKAKNAIKVDQEREALFNSIATTAQLSLDRRNQQIAKRRK